MTLHSESKSDVEVEHHPDRSGVYLQCHAVYTAATLQHTQCTCRIGSVCAVYLQPTLQIHSNYTAYTLHFGLGKNVIQGVFIIDSFCPSISMWTLPAKGNPDRWTDGLPSALSPCLAVLHSR